MADKENFITILLYVEGNIDVFNYFYDDVEEYINAKGFNDYTDEDNNFSVKIKKFGYIDPNFILFLNKKLDSHENFKFYIYKINNTIKPN